MFFMPATGTITEISLPSEERVDRWIERGATVSAFYDSLLAKIIVHRDFQPLFAKPAAARIFGFQLPRDLLALP